MPVRCPASVVILSSVVAGMFACGDDVAAVDASAASCDGATPVRVATLSAGTADYIRYHEVGEHLYINIYDMLDPVPNMPWAGALIDGQTWISGRCGEDAVLVGEGIAFDDGASFGALTPVFYGEDASDADVTLACDRNGKGDRVYRVDLFGRSQPELLLTGWRCGIDVTRMVTAYQNGEVHELWRVPNFPDLAGAVRLAGDVEEEIGWDATHNFYLDSAQAVHAVDIQSGDDEVLQTDVLRASGGATGSGSRLGQTGPTRLLIVTGTDEAEKMHLYRGETGELVPLAVGAWGFNSSRTFMHRQPHEVDAYIEVYDLDGAPLEFPEGVRSELVGSEGVLGSVEGPRWVYAPVGEAEAIALDMPWDPEIFVTSVGTEDVYWYRDDRLYRTPFDGGATVEVPGFGMRYTDDDALMQRGDQLLHLDGRTNESEVFVERVGTYAPAGDFADGKYSTYGVFYTDISEPEAPELWFMPLRALPGAE